MSNNSKLVRDIAPISDTCSVKNPGFFYVVTNDLENIFQGHVLAVSASKMDSRDKMRLDLCCCGSLGSQ